MYVCMYVLYSTVQWGQRIVIWGGEKCSQPKIGSTTMGKLFKFPTIFLIPTNSSKKQKKKSSERVVKNFGGADFYSRPQTNITAL